MIYNAILVIYIIYRHLHYVRDICVYVYISIYFL